MLSNVALPDLRNRSACGALLTKIQTHPQWPVYQEVFKQPPARLPSRRPIWTDMTQIDQTSSWRAFWDSATVVNKSLVSDPTIRQPVYHLRRQSWATLICFHTGQGLSAACRHRWRLSSSDRCRCGQIQKMAHCRLLSLHSPARRCRPSASTLR